MNKLINDFNRGFALKNDDLRFIDASIRQALADIAAVFPNSNTQACILWGCVVSSDVSAQTLSMSEGAILWAGEIWHLNAQVLSAPIPLPDMPFFCFKTTVDLAGGKLDKDLVHHETYQVRDCFVNLTGAIQGNIIGSVGFDVISRAKDLLIQSLTTTATAAISPLTPATTGTVRLRKMNGIVHVSGALSQQALPNSERIWFTLPEGYRPACAMSGEMRVQGATFSAHILWCLNLQGQFSVLLLSIEGTNDGPVLVPIPFQSFISA